MQDLFCPVCMRRFTCDRGLNVHLANADKCSWYRKEYLVAETLPEVGWRDIDPEQREDEDFEPGLRDNLDGELVDDDEPHFSKATLSTRIPTCKRKIPVDSEESPPPKKRKNSSLAETFVETHANASHKFGTREHIYQNWAAVLKDGSLNSNNRNLWAPFSSERDWKMAEWTIMKSGCASSSMDILLKIPKVCFDGSR